MLLIFNKISKPSSEGFDFNNIDYAEYASALESEHPNSWDETESDSIWTPTRRYKKMKASGSPLNNSYSQAVFSTVKKVPPSSIQTSQNSVKKYICIVYCRNEQLGKQNPIKIQKLMSNLVGTVKSINSTKSGNLIVECIDYQQYKKLLKTIHLGEWLIKVFVPKSMNTSIGCVYNVPLDISEEEIKEVLQLQNVSNCD